MWFLTRASGIVAVVLIAVAIADGLIFSSRATGRVRPAWWLDLHRGVGGYALAFTVLHVLAAYGADLGIGLADIVVPGHAEEWGLGFTLGVWALYGIALTVFTTWPRRRLRRRLWHVVHVLSVPAAVAAVVHGIQLGTDGRTWWYSLLMLALCGAVTYPLGLRIARRFESRTPTPEETPHVLHTPTPERPLATTSRR